MVLFLLIWYFIFLLAFVIWYLCFVSTIVLVFRLSFSFFNSVFAFSFCNFLCVLEQSYNYKKIYVLFLRYLFSFCNLVLCLLLLLHYGFLCLLIMAIERGDSHRSMNVRLNKKNYLYLSYVMRNVLKAKNM